MSGRYALGVGCHRGISVAALERLVRRVLRAHRLKPSRCAALGTIDRRGRDPAPRGLARKLGLALARFPARRLERETPRLASPSAAVFRRIGCHGVAESAALALAGPKARLVVAKQVGFRATCAVAAMPGTRR